MKITVNRAEFLLKLRKLYPIVSKRKSMPPTTRFCKLTTGVRDIELCATNLESYVRTVFPAVSIIAHGSCLLPIKPLIHVLRSISSEIITLEYLKISCIKDVPPSFNGTRIRNLVSLGPDMIIIRSGTHHFALAPHPSTDFPSMPEPYGKGFSVPRSELLQLLLSTEYAIYQEDSQFASSGSLLRSRNGRMESVATDGHQLAHVSCVSSTKADDILMPLNVTKFIPSLFSGEIVTISQDPDSSVKAYIYLNCGDTTFITKVVYGVFPEYEKIIPSHPHQIKLQVDILLSALKPLMHTANPRGYMVDMLFQSGLLSMYSENGEVGFTRSRKYVIDSDINIHIAFNLKYLINVFRESLCAELTMHLGEDNLHSVMFTGTRSDDYKFMGILMPLRG